ncbi:hypothetical protein JCM5353_007010 [Sporobolomyces roseus]
MSSTRSAPSVAPSTPRRSIDEGDEESAGLLSDYKDYPPPPSPPSLSSPFPSKSSPHNRRRTLLFISLLVFFTVVLASTYLQFSQVTRNRPIGTQSSIADSFHEKPEAQSLDRDLFLVDEAKLGHDYTVTAIVLHGLGQPNYEVPFIRRMRDQFPYVRWVSPTADTLDVTVRDYESTSAWFNIETFDDLSQGEHLNEFVHSQRQINELVDQERAKMIEEGKEPRIALMGFSQGAVMTLLSMLSSNATDRFEGCVALSAYVPLLDHLNDIVTPESKDIPLFWGHGQLDPYLTVDLAESGAELLKSDRIGLRKFEFHTYENLDHIWSEKELDDMAAWFKRTIPRFKGGRRRPNRPISSSLSSASKENPQKPDTTDQEKAQEEAIKWVEVHPLDDKRSVSEVRRRRARRF